MAKPRSQQAVHKGSIPLLATKQRIFMIYNAELLVFLFLLLIPFFIKRFPNPFISIPLSLIILSGLVASLFPSILNPYFLPAEKDSALFALSNISARSLLFFICALMVPNRRSTFIFFSHLSVLNSIYMLWRFFFARDYLDSGMWGMGLTDSFDSTMLAIIYPAVLTYSKSIKNVFLKYLYIALPVVAIILTKGSIGIGGLCVALFIINLSNRKLLLIPIGIFCFSIFYVPQLFSESSRLICWRWSLVWWWENANHWLGTGLGTYSILGPFIQVLTNNKVGDWYIEMHNDWLQCLFELGFAGVAVILSLVLFSIYKSRRSPYLLASIVTYTACAFLYYPTRNIITACYGVLLIKSAFDIVDE